MQAATSGQPLILRFKEICQQFGQKKAIEVDAASLTYQEMWLRVESWANYFRQQNVHPGSRVMVNTSHRSDFLAALFALWEIGAVPVPLEPTVPSVELVRAMNEARIHWVLSENVAHSMALSNDAELHTSPLQPNWLFARVSAYADDLCERDTAFFIYTSGTVGTPKCVIYDHTTAAAIIDSLIAAYNLSNRDTILTPLSPALSATLITGLLPGLVTGATLILPSEPVPGLVLKLIPATGCTIFFSVPYFYQLLIEAMEVRKKAHWGSVRLCLSTSAYLPGETFDAFYQLTHIPIRSIYCTSEANQCTFNSADDLILLRNSVGKPQRGVRIRIVDDQGLDVLPGQEGQIIVTGTHLSRGYFRRPDLEAKVYRDGWVYTGDLGALDAGGNLYITGRLSNTINVGGHLVNPQEVEQVLTSHPLVLEALVLGEGDSQVGERVVGWLVVKPGRHITVEELLHHCRRSLAHYKIPERIEFVSELPKGRYGKIRRLVPPVDRQIVSPSL